MISDYLQNLYCLFQNITCALGPQEDIIVFYILGMDTWKIAIFDIVFALLLLLASTRLVWDPFQNLVSHLL